MAVAASEPSVRAVVLMAPVVESSAHVAQVQYGRIGKPYLMRYAANGALKGVADAFAPGTPPVLTLQGPNDSMIDPQAARTFAARPDAYGRVSLVMYLGLGRSLGWAPSAREDGLLPMADKPLDDMAA